MRNIVRTKAVELETIPAIAYKQKLAAGGAGIKIHRLDVDAVAVYTLDRRSESAVPFGKTDIKLFPPSAVSEAVAVTVGLPFTASSRVVFKHLPSPKAVERFNKKLQAAAPACNAQQASELIEAATEEPEVDEPAAEEVTPEKICMVDTPEYQAIIKEYTLLNGKLDYRRMNKDFIQTANSGRGVKILIDKGVSLNEILLFVVKNRAAALAKRKDTLSDDEAQALVDCLDEIDPRSPFKELNAHIKRMLAK
ncbi:MAG: hypothetical protein FWH03_04660 [Firmicutes bacterium]|nr:hypothetical protein [Bacillota bacterium]